MKLTLKFKHLSIEKTAEIVLFSLLLLFTNGIALPSILGKLIGFLAYPAVLFLILQRWKKVIHVLTLDPSYLLLLALALSSGLWTVWPAGAQLFIRSIVNTTLLVAYICATYSPREQMQLWGKIFLTWGVMTFIVALILPNYTQIIGLGQKVRWQGIFVFKYPLGVAMTLGASLALMALLHSKRKKSLIWLCLLGSTLLVFLSQSTTSISALMSIFLTFPIYVLSKERNYKFRTVCYVLTFLVVATTIALITLNRELIIVDWLGKDLSLTGRIPYWQLTIEEGMRRPWFGFGPGGAFWQTEYALDIAFETGFPALPPTGYYLNGFHSHNGIIDLFLGFGLVGIGTFAINYLVVFTRVIRLYMLDNREDFFWMIQFIILMTIVNFSEAGTILASGNLIWILYSSIVLSSAVQQENLKQRQRTPHHKTPSSALPLSSSVRGASGESSAGSLFKENMSM